MRIVSQISRKLYDISKGEEVYALDLPYQIELNEMPREMTKATRIPYNPPTQPKTPEL